MAQANITWVENTQFIGTDSTQHSVVMSSPDDGIGMKPSELLLVALGGCTAYDVVSILSKKRAKLTELHVKVTGEQEADPPWTFRKIHISYRVGGVGLKEADVEKAIELSESKYCSVSATLKYAAEITFDFDVIETG
ncbi:MAG: OsmC family protein [Anaerolineales bacterium]